MTNGFTILPEYFERALQFELCDEISRLIADAPLFRPTMPRTGKPFSVLMSNCGELGWVSDQTGGYRYQPSHPETGNAWAPMPAILIETWQRLTSYPSPPQACLINVYNSSARMGLHRDADELDLDAPVLSISLGADALFRIGGRQRKDPTRSLWLRSGDVAILSDDLRHAYHGIDRIRDGTSRLLDAEPWQSFGICRINLTLRRVTCAGN